MAEQEDGLPAGWRRHARAAHLDLVQRWVGASGGRWLKTDLAEELTPARSLLPALPGTWIGVDVAVGACRRARHSMRAAADVRRLPFAVATFAGVLSTSTLDHFDDETELRRSLEELHRVLMPGGTLVLTLDNPTNPLIRLRNALPRRAQARTSLVPFAVGVTLSARRGVPALQEAGFVVEAVEHLLHAPHIVGTRLARFRWWERRALPAFDRLVATPLAPVTGHFVAFLARKPFHSHG